MFLRVIDNMRQIVNMRNLKRVKFVQISCVLLKRMIEMPINFVLQRSICWPNRSN